MLVSSHESVYSCHMNDDKDSWKQAISVPFPGCDLCCVNIHLTDVVRQKSFDKEALLHSFLNPPRPKVILQTGIPLMLPYTKYCLCHWRHYPVVLSDK